MDRSIGTLRSFLTQKKLRDNTLLWYCGDNGTPGDGIITSPLRGRKGQIFDGGIRVPGVIEWPAKIKSPIVSQVNSVTSDILPTLCEITGSELPAVPLDGISLTGLLDQSLQQRPTPIFFWMFNTGADKQREPWIDRELQIGTTPLVKMMGNIHTRNFTNFRHPEITPSDYTGNRAMLLQNYKLVIRGNGNNQAVELFRVPDDTGEETNVAKEHPEVVKSMQQHMKEWQDSVLKSLTGADYQ